MSIWYWLYDLHPGIAFVIITGFFVAFGAVGLIISEKTFKRRLTYDEDFNDQVSYYMSAIGIFYGITLGLVAVGAWENFDTVDDDVSKESATLGALYRDVSSFPDAARLPMQRALKIYTRYVIEEEWPMQQDGKTPQGGVAKLNDFQEILYAFKPTDRREEIIMAETLSKYNDYVTIRRIRLLSVNSGLPATIWLVTIIGALVCISFLWYYMMKTPTIQLIMISTISFFIGSMIFLILMMNEPFSGEICVDSDSFKLIEEQLMK